MLERKIKLAFYYILTSSSTNIRIWNIINSSLQFFNRQKIFNWFHEFEWLNFKIISFRASRTKVLSPVPFKIYLTLSGENHVYSYDAEMIGRLKNLQTNLFDNMYNIFSRNLIKGNFSF